MRVAPCGAGDAQTGTQLLGPLVGRRDPGVDDAGVVGLDAVQSLPEIRRAVHRRGEGVGEKHERALGVGPAQDIPPGKAALGVPGEACVQGCGEKVHQHMARVRAVLAGGNHEKIRLGRRGRDEHVVVGGRKPSSPAARAARIIRSKDAPLSTDASVWICMSNFIVSPYNLIRFVERLAQVAQAGLGISHGKHAVGDPRVEQAPDVLEREGKLVRRALEIAF